MAHGPKYSADYWFSEFDPSASHDRAMVLRRPLWFFSVDAHKTIHESGTYSCAWRVKLTQHSRTSQMEFSVTGVPKRFTLSNDVQDRLRGRDWFYVAIRDVRAEAGGRIRSEMKETAEIHAGYSLDCFIVLPADLLQGALPEDGTFWLN